MFFVQSLQAISPSSGKMEQNSSIKLKSCELRALNLLQRRDYAYRMHLPPRLGREMPGACRERQLLVPHHHPRKGADNHTPFSLPPFIDLSSLLVAISEVPQGMAERRITRSDAGTLLFGLQLAPR